MREFPIFGGTEKEKIDAIDALAIEQQADFGAVSGESVKTAEDLKLIDAMNIFIQVELRRLGLSMEMHIKHEQVHFLDQSAWDLKFPNDKSQGRDCLGGIYVSEAEIEKEGQDDPSVNSKFKRFSVMLHECIHLLGHKKFMYTEGDFVDQSRAGYKVTNISDEEKDDYFQAFNEGIIDLITGKILKDNTEELVKQFGVTDLNDLEVLKKYLNYYGVIALISNIVAKIAETTKKQSFEVWDNMMRNYFTGNMMFLRDVETAYGKGALRLLGMVNVRPTKDQQEIEKQAKLQKYFILETSEEERQKIALELL